MLYNKSFFINYSSLDKLARYGMLLGFCFDLSGHLGLRMLFSFPCVLYLLLRNLYTFKDNFYIFGLFFLLGIFPLFQLLKGYVLYDPNEFVVSQFMSTFQMIFLYISLKNVDGNKLLNEFLNSIFIVQICVLVLFLGGLLGNPILTYIIHFLGVPFNGGYFGFLLVDGYTVPQIYFKSTLFYIFPTIYFFSEKKYIKSLISIITLVLALSKAGSVLALFGILILIIKRKKIYDFFFILIFILLIGFFGESYLNNYLELKDSYTLYVRDMQIRWFQNWIFTEPIDFIFGMGLGSNVKIPGFGIASALELDHLDTIRKYGFLWFIIIIIILFKIIIKSFSLKNHFGITIAFIMTFIGVGTNPLFLTSLFFIITFIIYKLNHEQISY
jgi:hypothetical protein